MKKVFLPVILILAMLLILSACGSSNGSDNGNASSNFDTSNSISVTAREDESGTKNAFMEIVGLMGKADPANAIIQNSTAEILTEVKGNPTAIAYESLGYITEEVKMLKIDGVEATVANIKDGTYKISRPLSVVYKDEILDTPLFNAFYIFLQSSAALDIVADGGYVTLLDSSAPYMVDDSLSEIINISGSTSLKPLMELLAGKFSDLQPEVTVNVSGGGSGQGYGDAENDVVQFGMISEEFHSEKAPGCIYYTICKDGIAVIVHKDNPLNDITLEQLRSIYDVDAGSDAVSTWSMLIK